MSNPDLQRVLVDFYNRTDSDVYCETVYNVDQPIVPKASDYYCHIELANVDHSKLTLDPAAEYSICVDYLEKDYLTNIVPGRNFFHFKQPVNKVSEFTEWVSYVLTKMCLEFPMGRLDVATDIKKFQLNIPTGQSANWSLYYVYVSASMVQLLPRWVESTPSFTNNGVKYHRWYFAHSDGQTVHEIPTVNKLAKFKSIRIYTTLPVRDTRVQNQTTGTIISENLLGTIALNTAGYDLLGQTDSLYIPTFARDIELVTDAPVSSFGISLQIYYKTGIKVYHVLAPDEYFNMQLLFVKKPHLLIRE